MEFVGAISFSQRREPLVFSATAGIFALQCYTIASITVLYYDHLITFPHEYRKIWKRRLSVLNILFILNRYTTCLGYIPVVYFVFNSPQSGPAQRDFPAGLVLTGFLSRCNSYVRYPAVLSIVSQAIISVIVTLRCYALYNQSRKVLIPVSVLGLAVLGSFVWATTDFVGIDLDFGGLYRTCVPDLKSGTERTESFKVAWLLSIIFDSVVLALTLYRTVQFRKLHQFAGSYGSLTNLIIRDGSIYFVVMALSYIIHIILFVYINNSFFAYSTGDNAFFTHTISVTMMSRLILNLNGYGDRHARVRSHLNGADAVGLQPSTQFTTEVAHYSTWIARTAREFETWRPWSEGSEETSEDVSVYHS